LPVQRDQILCRRAACQYPMPAVAGGRKRRPRCGVHWTADRASDPLHKGIARRLRPIDRPHCVWL